MCILEINGFLSFNNFTDSQYCMYVMSSTDIKYQKIDFNLFKDLIVIYTS